MSAGTYRACLMSHVSFALGVAFGECSADVIRSDQLFPSPFPSLRPSLRQVSIGSTQVCRGCKVKVEQTHGIIQCVGTVP